GKRHVLKEGDVVAWFQRHVADRQFTRRRNDGLLAIAQGKLIEDGDSPAVREPDPRLDLAEVGELRLLDGQILGVVVVVRMRADREKISLPGQPEHTPAGNPP